MTFIDGFTLGLAIVASLLGLLNTWRAYDRDRIRVRVHVDHAFPFGWDGKIVPDARGFQITAVNLSYLPITVRRIDFLLPGRERFVILKSANGLELPRRMEARTSIAFVATDILKDPRIFEAKCAVVDTECGRSFRSSRREFRLIARESAAAAEKAPADSGQE